MDGFERLLLMKQPNRHLTLVVTILVVLGVGVLTPRPLWANPWNGKVVLQAFWWDAWKESYPQDWYTYLAKLAPRLRELGFDGIWIPSPAKGNSGTNSMGYDIFDHYDLGDKDQKGTVATRFGSKDSLLRLVAVLHANGLEVYPDIVLNHVSGGEEDPQAPGDKFKKFRYVGFSGSDSGRWAKDHWNFHPNPDHQCTAGDICEQSFGPDVCYLDADHGGGGNGKYMRDRAREWFVWLTKQIGADGFRFDAVKHYEAYVVEDLLYNAMGDRLDYFSVGEYVGSQQQLDAWVDQVQNRAGTFDFPLREALAQVVDGSGFFDMGSLPNAQQKNRLKTVPFVNNHDTWRGHTGIPNLAHCHTMIDRAIGDRIGRSSRQRSILTILGRMSPMRRRLPSMGAPWCSMRTSSPIMARTGLKRIRRRFGHETISSI
jgi:alpha-amylase